MKKNSSKKYFSVVLILSQLASASQVFAASDQTPSPEGALLASIYSLKGQGKAQGLSESQMSAEIIADYKNYDEKAPLEGRLARLESAMVDMNLYSQDQISSLDSSIQVSNARLVNQGFSSQQEAAQAFASEVQYIASTSLNGAQFSGDTCDTLKGVAYGAFGVGGTVAGIGGLLYFGQGSYEPAVGPNASAIQSNNEGIHTAGDFALAGMALVGVGVILAILGRDCH